MSKHAIKCRNEYIRDVCGGINEFKKGYQTGTNLVADDSSGLLVDCHKILNR
jgi:hypothetical protein